MSRSLAIAIAAVIGGCSGSGDGAKKSSSEQRVNAVVQKGAAKVDLAEFCETQHGPDKAVPFKLPELGPDSAPADGAGKWRWVNVWATWCKPCVEELPMLAKWRERLKTEGLDATIQFLSVDGEADLVRRFRTDHPGAPESLRIAQAEALGGWLGGMGIEASAVLPIHLFVDPADRLRCVRMGGVASHDWDFVKRILSQD